MVTTFLKTAFAKQFQRAFLNRFSEKFQKTVTPAEKEEDIGLFDAANLHACPWPKTEDGLYAQKSLSPLIKEGVLPYIKNVRTDLRVLIYDQLVFPITLNEAEYDNSYVCSPYSYFISYARESLALMTKKWALRPINSLLWGAEKIFRRFQINKVVMVNNWLYSTNLYPCLQPHHIEAIVNYLQKHFPDFAIVFRSIDPYTSPICYQALQNYGFAYIASRQIFFIQPWETTLFDSRLFKSDLKLLNNSGYEIIDSEHITEKEIPRLIQLYNDLYIEKFSDLNPQFTEEFMHLALKEKILHVKALKKDGRIDGVVGFLQRNGEMFCPFFGYDRSLPHEPSLYRLLSTVLMLEADRRHLLFHQSSGASMYKKIRKAQSCIEYMAVGYRHLPLKRRMPWVLLEKMCNSLGIIFMKRY